jgi:hypothetical protein
MTGEPSLEGLQSIPTNLSGSLEPNRAETSFCFSCSTLTQKCPLASMACHDRDTLVGQNKTNGGVQRQGGERLACEADGPTLVQGGDHGDARAELTEHIAECAGVERLPGH